MIDRLSHIYDEVYIDEVQDLTGCDLHILEQLMIEPRLDRFMVGDVRQSVFDTNPQDPNLRKYRGVKMLNWFDLHRRSGLIRVLEKAQTWRSNALIAEFSDSLFPKEFSFEPTISKQVETTGHDGVFALSETAVSAYLNQYSPQPLRATSSTARSIDLDFENFGKVKGLTFDRVLIYPTKPVIEFLTTGAELAPKAACGLYVAVTRARYSVAFVTPNPSATALAPYSPVC